MVSEAGGIAVMGLTRSNEKNVLAAAVRDSMIRLGPSTVKIGQALSARGDLIGAEGISELQQLQDDIPWSFSTEDAKRIIREDLLSGDHVTNEQRTLVEQLISSLSAAPIAAASIGQVYRGKTFIPGVGDNIPVMTDLAVKVQRPDLRETAAADFFLARMLASALGGIGLLRSDGVGAVDEYASRLFEEMNYRNEAENMVLFGALYGGNGCGGGDSSSGGGSSSSKSSEVRIMVPRLIKELSSDRVITMTWLNGEKLIGKDAAVSPADLPLLQLGIECSLSQILETGVLHADPHGGNLLKGENGALIYLDFGLVAKVPLQVREALVCSVVYLIERNFSALAREFDSLMLMPTQDLQVDLAAFEVVLKETADRVLDFCNQPGGVCDVDDDVGADSDGEDDDENGISAGDANARGGWRRKVASFVRNPEMGVLMGTLSIMEKLSSGSGSDDELSTSTAIPKVKFGEIINALLDVSSRFRFVIPPYFINNVRAIGTLEGMALSADPDFRLLDVVYPFVLRKMLADITETGSSEGSTGKARAAFRNLILKRDTESGLLLPRWKRLRRLIKDASQLSMSKRRAADSGGGSDSSEATKQKPPAQLAPAIYKQFVFTTGGRRFMAEVMGNIAALWKMRIVAFIKLRIERLWRWLNLRTTARPATTNDAVSAIFS